MKEQISSQAGALVDTLIERGMRVTTAESCTGGLVSAAITEVRGSSAVFEGGAVCYANEVKSSILGVNEEIFATKGAVSGECAEAMAQGAATLFLADLAIALTGIAGPDGGSPQKPVGTVFICVTIRDRGRFFPMVVENHFSGNREEIRKQSVLKALRLANAALAGEIYDDLPQPLLSRESQTCQVAEEDLVTCDDDPHPLVFPPFFADTLCDLITVSDDELVEIEESELDFDEGYD